MNKKQIIRLNESQLKRVVEESVKMVLKEDYGDYSGAGGPFLDDIVHNMSLRAKEVLELLDSMRSEEEGRDEITRNRLKERCESLFVLCYRVMEMIKELFPNNERIQYFENHYKH